MAQRSRLAMFHQHQQFHGAVQNISEVLGMQKNKPHLNHLASAKQHRAWNYGVAQLNKPIGLGDE